MSLLLDALKKAAEQKAQKDKADEQTGRPSDDTQLNTGLEDPSGLQTSDESNVQVRQSPRDDETVLDDSTELRSGDASDLRVPPPARDDETALEESTALRSGDESNVRIPPSEREDETALEESTALRSGDESNVRIPPSERDDETRLDDSTELKTSEDTYLQTPPAAREDETALDDSTAMRSSDESNLRVPPSERDDETRLDDATELKASEETYLQTPPPARDDETQLDYSDYQTKLERVQEKDAGADKSPADRDDETELKGGQVLTGEDETIIIADEDVSDFMGEPRLVNREVEDETVLDQSEYRAQMDSSEAEATGYDTSDDTGLEEESGDSDDVEFSDKPRPPAQDTDISVAEDTETTQNADVTMADITSAQNDDLSLILAEREDTQLAGGTSLTDTESSEDHATILRGEDVDEIELVAQTQLDMPDEPTEPPSRTSATSTTGLSLDNLTTESTTTRADSTSTRTYAPDNYDRTLMKLPGEDASKLFAGMRSDPDVVMTPDYAKKVFQSKSSAQRMQHYKVYGGIAVAILLAIGIYGLFEMQEETFNIETSLRPLKRDPMPGIIKPAEEGKQELFGGSEVEGVDAKTLELIESAESDAVAGEAVSEAASVEPESTGSETIESAETSTQDEIEALVESDESTVSGTIVTESVDTASDQTASEAGVSIETASIQSSGGTQTSGSTSGVIADENAAEIAASQDTNPNLHIVSSKRLEEKHALLREAYEAYLSGDDELALAKYNEVLEIDPGNRNALLARAAINVQNNRAGEAIADYRQLLLANPKDTLAMTSLIAVANVSPADAETQLKLMIRDEPDSPYLNFALANAYGAQNRWREAQNHYFTALENNPGDPNYAYNLAVSLEHIAKPKVAVSYYQRALDNMSNGLAMFSKEVVDRRLEMLGKL